MAKTIVIESLNKPRTVPSSKTQIVLVGLTPGQRQHTAINRSEKALDGSFLGMRKQIFTWFEILRIAKVFDLKDENSLFSERRFEKFAYITSLLREPVYVKSSGKKENYSGRSPFPWRHEGMTELMFQTLGLLDELKQPCLIVPMGQVVSQAIERFSSLDEKHYILHGFPHPSGANGGRAAEFAANCTRLKTVVANFRRQLGKNS